MRLSKNSLICILKMIELKWLYNSTDYKTSYNTVYLQYDIIFALNLVSNLSSAFRQGLWNLRKLFILGLNFLISKTIS